MKGLIHKLLSFPFAVKRIEKKVDDLLILEARRFFQQFDYTKPLQSFEEVECKIFSQWGDDGIIQYLIRKLGITKKIFIEFGVENYREANTRFLLVNNNWRGLIFDGSSKNVDIIKKDEIFWRYSLNAECAFIAKENINQLIEKNGFTGGIGLLHIDIDGNDYWIWDAINNTDAEIVIMEYNAYFGDEKPITIPYSSDFSADKAHYSRLYFGASLPALIHLANKKGYFHVGCNSAGNNAYFVKNKYAGSINEVSAKEGFVMPTSRQSRNRKGELSFIGGNSALELLKQMPVINVVTGETEYL